MTCSSSRSTTVSRRSRRLAATETSSDSPGRPRPMRRPPTSPNARATRTRASVRNGVLETGFVPNIGDEEFGPPDLDIDDLPTQGSSYFTTDSIDGDVTYRVLAEGLGDVVLITALPLDDVNDTISQLVWVEVLGCRADPRRARARQLVGDPPRHPAGEGDDPDRDAYRRRRSHRAGARVGQRDRVGGTRRRPQPDARAHRRCARRAGRLRGPASPVRRRRIARTAHARHHDPGLRRAVPARWARRSRRARRRHASNRAGGDAHGPPRRGHAGARQARRGAPARGAAGRSRPARRRRRRRRPSRVAGTIDHRRRRRANRRWSTATRTACGR